MATQTGPDGIERCAWCLADAEYIAYHDTEWGHPVADDTRLFEMLSLEGFQAGLSWRTILAKRENFRAAFASFDPARVAAFTETDIARLLADRGIVRHRGKIEAVIGNARLLPALRHESGSLAAHVWSIADAAALSKDLRRRGWRFVGPTTMVAFLQAAGIVNDHAPGCASRAGCDAARAMFIPPARRSTPSTQAYERTS